MHQTIRTLIVLSLGTPFAGCAMGADSPESQSANASAYLGVCDSIRTDPEPRWVAGDESEGPWFGAVTAALMGEDGRVYVADGVQRRVHLLDDDGTLIRSFGEDGDGPGGFVSISSLHPHPRGIAVYDAMARRISVFDPDGEIIVTIPRPETIETPLTPLAGVFDDGSVVYAVAEPTSYEPLSISRQLLELRSFDSDHQSAGTLATIPDSERFFGLAGSFGAYRRPFGTRTSVGVVGDEVFIATGDSSRVVFIGGGGETRAIEVPDRSRPVTSDDRAAYAEKTFPPETRDASANRLIVELPYPDRTPPFTSAIAGTDGSLWIAQESDTDSSTIEYLVVDKEGHLIETVLLEPDVRVLDSSADAVLVGLVGPFDLPQLGMLGRICHQG